ncbi:MAG: TetR/AcrR family transcriptional regulator C-terminal domain-containing protein [Agathobacter sp.]
MTHDEINKNTKRAYAEALRRLLAKKSIQKISIAELSDACQKNRNTFYYHFSDIYDLLKWMLEQESQYIMTQIQPLENSEASLRFILNYIYDNKEDFRKIYQFFGHDEMRRLYYNNIYSLLENIIRHGEEQMNVYTTDDFRRFLSAFYTEAFAGIIVTWIIDEKAEQPEELLQKLFFISKHSIPKLIREYR